MAAMDQSDSRATLFCQNYYQVAASLAVAQFGKEVAQNASKFDWQNFNNATLKRLFDKISGLGTAAQQDQAKLEEVSIACRYMQIRQMSFVSSWQSPSCVFFFKNVVNENTS